MPATDLFHHLRLAFADGAAGHDFTPPVHTPFASKRDAEEDAYGEFMRGRDERSTALDNAIAKQPHAFQTHGRAAPRCATTVGAEVSTPPAASAPEKNTPLSVLVRDPRAALGGFMLGMILFALGAFTMAVL